MSIQSTVNKSRFFLRYKDFLNSKRIRDYPRLFFVAGWAIIILNIILRKGWIGGITRYLIWGDFLTYYAAGKLFRDDIANLYDLGSQIKIQSEIISAGVPIEVSMYSYPPNSALVHSALTYLTYSAAVTLWAFLAIFCVILAARLINQHLLPAYVSNAGLSSFQITILLLSSFAFIEGFEKGQSHSLSFLLIVGVLVAMRKEKWILAGILAALSSYKPHFIVGFLLLWFIWRRYKAIISFTATFTLWNSFVLATKGIDPYIGFITFSEKMIYIPYTSAGFPKFIMATPFALVATALPFDLAPAWNSIFLFLAAAVTTMFIIITHKARKQPVADQNILQAVAMLLPFIATPYALLHDLLILLPVFALLAVEEGQGKQLLYLAVGVYLSLTILPLAGYVFNLALTGIIPCAVFLYSMRRLIHQSRDSTLVNI